MKTRLTFRNRISFYAAQNILLGNGYNRPTSPQAGNGYFSTDENWQLIDFDSSLETAILPLLQNIEYRIEQVPYMKYVTHNQGGYLD
jgi:hypothetical protein